MRIVLSLFDGMSCGQLALRRADVPYQVYYAAEVDKPAIKVTQHNFPNTIQMGDVTKWREWAIPWQCVDLLIGGSPCQGFSFAGKQLAFDDPRSKLFFVYVDILNHIRTVNPRVKFMLENVKMKKEYLNVISSKLYAMPVFINSALVSAQNRQRFYWANWKIEQPEDRKIYLRDILEYGVVDRDKAHCIDANYFKGGNPKSYFEKHRRPLVFDTPHRVATASDIKGHDSLKRIYSENGKAPTLTTCGGGHQEPKVLCIGNNSRIKGFSEDERGIRPHRGDKAKSGLSELGRILKVGAEKTDTLTAAHMPKLITERNSNDIYYRKLTPVECERLQTVPDGYTDAVSNTQRYKMLGNGWTVDVIAHIFKGLL